MDDLGPYTVRPIGVVRSTLRAVEDAPHQADGAPGAVLEIESRFTDAPPYRGGRPADRPHLAPRPPTGCPSRTPEGAQEHPAPRPLQDALACPAEPNRRPP